jgi:outer membrane protein assembly factor BamA
MRSTNGTYYFWIVLMIVAFLLAAPVTEALCQSQESGTAENQETRQAITKIGVIGGHDIDRKLVLARFGVHTGDPFDADECERGIERVSKLAGVESAILRILADREGGGVHLVIVISDANTRIMRPALSRYLTNDWSFGLRFEESNFRGMDEEVKSLLLLGGVTVAKASWMKPFFIENPRFGVGLSAQYEQYDYPYPDYERLITENRIKRFQAAGRIRLNITDFANLSILPGVDIIETADTISYGCIREGGRKDWGVLESDSEMKNFLYWTEGSGYLNIWRIIGVLHSRAVLTHGDVPLLLLQHLGGEGSIRGYDFGIISGGNSLLATAEARLPLNFEDPYAPGNPLVLFDFHLFMDSGACWSGTESFDTDLLHSGFGCGVNMMPGYRGLISVEYAWQIETSGTWHVNAGFYF